MRLVVDFQEKKGGISVSVIVWHYFWFSKWVTVSSGLFSTRSRATKSLSLLS